MMLGLDENLIADGLLLHADLKWVDPHKFDNAVIDESVDTGEDRCVFTFGAVCPLPLGSDKDKCRSYKDKLNQCRSYSCSEFARNYLARHAYDSTNHPDTNGRRQDAFDAAEGAEITTELESKEDRDVYREQLRTVEKRVTQMKMENEDRMTLMGSVDDTASKVIDYVERGGGGGGGSLRRFSVSDCFKILTQMTRSVPLQNINKAMRQKCEVTCHPKVTEISVRLVQRTYAE